MTYYLHPHYNVRQSKSIATPFQIIQILSLCTRFMVYESGNIYVIKNEILQPEMTYCGGTGIFPKDYQSYSNVVTIRFLTDGISSADAGVKLVYTSYKPPQGKPSPILGSEI